MRLPPVGSYVVVSTKWAHPGSVLSRYSGQVLRVAEVMREDDELPVAVALPDSAIDRVMWLCVGEWRPATPAELASVQLDKEVGL